MVTHQSGVFWEVSSPVFLFTIPYPCARLSTVGRQARAQSYRKSVPVFCLLPPNHFLFWSHILCWKTESTNAFKFLSHKRLERGKESFYVRITCEGWMAVAFLRHEQLLYNTCQGPRRLQDKEQSQLLPRVDLETENNIYRLANCLPQEKRSKCYFCVLANFK